jgi:hypothetical protein
MRWVTPEEPWAGHGRASELDERLSQPPARAAPGSASGSWVMRMMVDDWCQCSTRSGSYGSSTQMKNVPPTLGQRSTRVSATTSPSYGK